MIIISHATTKPQVELTQYNQWKKCQFLSEIKTVKFLGEYDDIGHLREKRLLGIGYVVQDGNILPSSSEHRNNIKMDIMFLLNLSWMLYNIFWSYLLWWLDDWYLISQLRSVVNRFPVRQGINCNQPEI